MKFNTEKAGKLHERRLHGCRLPAAVNRLRGLLLGICFLTAGSFVTHPYYMSVTELEYKSKEKEIQIACKIFTDDFEDALKQIYGQKIDLNNTGDAAKSKTIVADYLAKHLTLFINNRPLKLEFLGYEQEGETTWSYLAVKNVLPFKKVTVKNDVLYQYRKDQINIIHFTNNGNRKSYRISFPESNHEFIW